jgi:branched-chain amino acid transport system substrate-binding protein
MFALSRLSSSSLRLRAAVAAVVVVSVISASVAIASGGIPGTDRLIAACYNPASGVVHFVPQGTTCNPSEVAISLPSREYVDAAVAAEAALRSGGDADLLRALDSESAEARAGEAAATTRAFETGTSVLGPAIPIVGQSGQNATPILSLDLPAGVFAVTTVVHVRGGGHATVTCGVELGDRDRIDTANVGTATGDSADTSIVLAFTATQSESAPARLRCWLGNNSGPNPVVVTSSLLALRIGERTFAPPSPRAKIVSSLPLQGSAAADSRGIVNAITLALEEVSFRAGGVTLDYVSTDDSTAAQQNWDATQEAANAQAAASDPSVVVYIGPYNSGAARVSIPILCQAGLAMISPSNTYPGLTKTGLGTADEPSKYYPNGCVRNYTRVIPSDDVQGAVGSAVAANIGATNAYVIDDGTVYGHATALTFQSTAVRHGVTLVGFETLPQGSAPGDLAVRVAASGASFVYYGGLQSTDAAALLQAIRGAQSQASFMVPEPVVGPAFVQQAGSAANGTIATTLALDPAVYTAAQNEWANRYRARFGMPPSVYAIYGYEAARVAIAALTRAAPNAANRSTMRAAITSTANFSGVLGTWSFDANGDTSYTTMTLFRVVAGNWTPQGTASSP